MSRLHRIDVVAAAALPLFIMSRCHRFIRLVLGNTWQQFTVLLCYTYYGLEGVEYMINCQYDYRLVVFTIQSSGYSSTPINFVLLCVIIPLSCGNGI